MSKISSHAAVILFFLFAGSVPVLAQTTTATISGTVKDETGAVLPGVSIRVENPATGTTRTALTDDEGRYRVPELSPGEYQVAASLTGFQTTVRSGIHLTVGRHAVLDIILKVGAVDETITVTEEAPLIETTSAALAGLVSEQQIRDLPLNGRNFVQLTLLETGVVQARTAGTSAVVGVGLKMSFHGARMDYNNFMMDGTSINSVNQFAIGGASGQAMGVETIREFQVVTSNFSAEFGRAGGGVINVVTKGGTNEFRGSAFYFHRNDNLDARNFFDRDPSQPTRRSDPPEFKRNQFGFTAGGPIRRDKTFVFGGYEGLREGLGRTLFGNVPSAAARQGAVAPSVKPYLDLYPLPNGRDFGDGRAEFTRGDTEITRQDFFQVRVDQTFSDADSFFARYTMDDSDKAIPQTLGTWVQNDQVRSQYVTLEEKHIVSATLLNVARFGFNRTVVNYTQKALEPRVLDRALWFFPNGSVPGLGQLGVSGLAEPGGAVNRPRYRLDNVFQWSDTVTYSRGAHSLKTGGEVQRIQTNEAETFRGQGTFTFANLGNFLANRPTRFIGAIEDSDWPRGWRQSLFALFLQDDIRIHRKLTVNLGLRWEFITGPSEVNGKAAHFIDPRVETASTIGNPAMILPKDNLGPRVGFAWDPFGDGKTSVRGGFGLFHQMIFRNFYLAASNLMPPFVQAFSLEGPSVTFPHPVLPRTGAQAIGAVHYQNNKLPYMMQYNLSVQRELMPNTVFTVGYVGSRGVHLGRMREPNNAIAQILSDGRKFFAAGLQRRNPAWTDIFFRTLEANSVYNSFQLRLTRRVAQGLSFQTAYTLAHAIDDASGGTATADIQNSSAQPQDPDDLRAERGNSSFDIRQVLTMNFVYDVPFGRQLAGIGGRLLGGWQINGIVNITDGVAFTAENSGSLDRDRDRSLTNGRPNLAPGRSGNPVLGGPDRYYDPASFQLQEPGFYGNLGRNTVIGPGLATVDFALIKNFALREEKNVQFRAEFFNLFNRANFNLPDRIVFRVASGVPSGTAGRITSTGTTSRQIQLGLKILF